MNTTRRHTDKLRLSMAPRGIAPRLCCCLLAASVALAAVAGAQDDTAGQRPAHAPIKAEIADLAWIAGAWKGEGLGGKAEEHWAGPAGGSMLGMFRLVNAAGKATVFELLLIEQDGEHVVFRFRHFGPGHRPWEEADKPLTFDLVRLVSDPDANRHEAVFDSTMHDQPRRMTYTRDGDELTIRVQNARDGEIQPGFDVRMRSTRLGD